MPSRSLTSFHLLFTTSQRLSVIILHLHDCQVHFPKILPSACCPPVQTPPVASHHLKEKAQIPPKWSWKYLVIAKAQNEKHAITATHVHSPAVKDTWSSSPWARRKSYTYTYCPCCQGTSSKIFYTRDVPCFQVSNRHKHLEIERISNLQHCISWATSLSPLAGCPAFSRWIPCL